MHSLPRARVSCAYFSEMGYKKDFVLVLITQMTNIHQARRSSAEFGSKTVAMSIMTVAFKNSLYRLLGVL
ncbi:hypothetical protein D3C77_736860 [compost metagenome]